MRYSEQNPAAIRSCVTVIMKRVVLCSLWCYFKTHSSYVASLRLKKIYLQEKEQGEKTLGNASLPLKNGSVPWDMWVWCIMTFSVDLLRQIATDPHGFSRAHSIGNGLFNFPQEALPFPHHASLKRHFTLCCIGQINK